MLRPRTTTDTADTYAKLDDTVSRLRIEGALAEADPFDDAMTAAVAGAAEALKSEAGALADLDARFGRLARRA